MIAMSAQLAAVKCSRCRVDQLVPILDSLPADHVEANLLGQLPSDSRIMRNLCTVTQTNKCLEDVGLCLTQILLNSIVDMLKQHVSNLTVPTSVLLAKMVTRWLHSVQMDLRVVKECLAWGTRRTPLTENVAPGRATSRQ